MRDSLPTVLVPALLCSPRLFADILPALWSHGPVTVADHQRDDSMRGIAQRILQTAPPRFALMGLSMGGYVAFEILRQAPERVARLALLDTTARPDSPEQSQLRRQRVSLARAEGIDAVSLGQFERSVHPQHHQDEGLREIVRRMGVEVGVEGFARQQAAIMTRPDSRPDLPSIRCRTLVVVGEGDEMTPRELAAEMADGIPGADLFIVPGAGHLSTLEQPEVLGRALSALLES